MVVMLADRRALRLAVTLTALAGVFAACGDDTAETPLTQPAVLDGRTFVSRSTAGLVLVDGTTVRLTFSGGGLSMNAGCNTIFGPYTVNDGVLQTGTLGSTEKACDEALMEQDRQLTDLLASNPSIRLDGDTLTLTGTGLAISLLDRVVADPDRPLEGTVWTVDGVIDGDAISNGWGGAVATLTIVDGRAVVHAGCNSGGASVTVGDGTLTFGSVGLTKMACAPEVMELEAAVVAVLNGEVTYRIEADVLTITSGAATSGTRGLQLRADR
jgi:heat shock protein HslJ